MHLEWEVHCFAFPVCYRYQWLHRIVHLCSGQHRCECVSLGGSSAQHGCRTVTEDVEDSEADGEGDEVAGGNDGMDSDDDEGEEDDTEDMLELYGNQLPYQFDKCATHSCAGPMLPPNLQPRFPDTASLMAVLRCADCCELT